MIYTVEELENRFKELPANAEIVITEGYRIESVEELESGEVLINLY